ncbi:DUF6334 family protein [Sphingomonas sp. HITSZ_GF]|uniref:DUF6334 family protein n=1 Tax=Sphingomonas sp. HITSZ_GF TaxID=3037247 RepID=UPI00240E335C|nr:DUF6334 family protein [Sphingomonas sp. HITSZ_GF]MDG2534490.1 DUF6334 family protein [Sphingomonas sp. HITSZ_GF]
MTNRTMLQFDYATVHGHTVTAVLGETRYGAPGWWAIAIQLGSTAIVLRVDEDSDEIIALLDEEPLARNDRKPLTTARWEPVAALAEAIGSTLGWCWIGRNYLGYLDMFTLSFDGLEPQFCFVGVASQVEIKRITAIH